MAFLVVVLLSLLWKLICLTKCLVERTWGGSAPWPRRAVMRELQPHGRQALEPGVAQLFLLCRDSPVVTSLP